MKLRQKLAAVMAATMVVTAVPTVTMGATSNTVSNTVAIVKDSTMGYQVTESTTSTTYTVNGTTGDDSYAKRNIPTVELKALSDNNFTATGESFFVEIENATFTQEAFIAYNNGGSLVINKETNKIEGGNYDGKTVEEAVKAGAATIEVQAATTTRANAFTVAMTRISDTELKVTVTGQIDKDEVIKVPLLAKAKSGEVAVSIDGSESFVSTSKVVVGATTASDQKLTATVSSPAKLSNEGGKIGDIVIAEQVLDTIKDATGSDRVISIELESSSDLEFVAGQVTLKGGRGFAAISKKVNATLHTKANGDKDTQILEIAIPADFQDPTARGTISIQGIEVQPENKTAKTGDVVVTVSNKNMEDTKLTVATIFDHLVVLTCEKPSAVVAGKEAQTVEFTLAEQAIDSIIANRKATFTLDNGFIAVRAYDAATNTYKSAYDTFAQLVADKKIVLPTGITMDDIVEVEANKEGQIIGFTVEFNNLSTTKVNSYTIKMPVMTELNTTGEVKLAVEGRALSEKLETVVANVTAPFTVAMETAALKVGLNGQNSGSLTITETAAGMFEKGEVTIAMPEAAEGITFVKNQELDIEAKGLRIRDVKVYTDSITFEVERTSTEAGSIEIKGIEFNVNRLTPEGKFDLEIAGSAITENAYIKAGVDRLTVKDFVVITTVNTEDMTASNGLKKGTASFVLNSTKYTVNGEEKTMDAAAYATEGRIMVPVRYVSEAFGIEGNNIAFNKGVVTLFAGNRIVQLTLGSNIAVVNGVQIAMDAKVEAKDGRTFIPVGELGRILDVNVSWNNETKTATFTN